MAAAIDDRVSYGLDIVCDLEKEMTNIMPKSWIEDMMFLKANNICAPTGLAPKKLLKPFSFIMEPMMVMNGEHNSLKLLKVLVVL